MTNNKTTKIGHDLMADIKALEARVYKEAEAKGLSRYLVNHGAISVRPHGGSDFHAGDITIGFQPNYGLDFKLFTPVTDAAHAWPINTFGKRQKLAALVAKHMEHLVATAPVVAKTRADIKRAAQQVLDEALNEGLEMEILRIETAPVHVYQEPGQTNRRGECKQVFYVHVLMPHDDEGVLTQDVWTIDADDAEEFADYLRTSVLPELREMLAKFAAPAAG
jgi:hypothetical protein